MTNHEQIIKHRDNCAHNREGREQIRENRIKFIEEFGVAKLDTTRTLEIIEDRLFNCGSIYDHLECYRTKSGGVIILNSPYGYEECPGMVPYIKLYNTGANTFIQHFDSLKCAKQWGVNSIS